MNQQKTNTENKKSERQPTIVGSRMRALMNVKGYSLASLAKELGKSKAAIVGYTQGYRYPQIKDINEIAKVLETSVSYLTGDTDHPAPPLTHEEATSLAKLIETQDFHYDGKKLSNDDLQRIIKKLNGLIDDGNK